MNFNVLKRGNHVVMELCNPGQGVQVFRPDPEDAEEMRDALDEVIAACDEQMWMDTDRELEELWRQ